MEKRKLFQKQPFRGVLWRRCSENMQHTYRGTLMLKCDFNKVALQNNFFSEQLWTAASVFFLWKDHSQMKQIFIVEQIYIKYPNTFWADLVWMCWSCSLLFSVFLFHFSFLWDYSGEISETNKQIRYNERSRFSKEVK